MSTIDSSSSFIRYSLTEEELLEGSILTELQRQVIQNQLANAAEERIKLVFTPENVQRDAELQGTIITLQYLLDISKRLEQDRLAQMQAEANQQSSFN